MKNNWIACPKCNVPLDVSHLTYDQRTIVCTSCGTKHSVYYPNYHVPEYPTCSLPYACYLPMDYKNPYSITVTKTKDDVVLKEYVEPEEVIELEYTKTVPIPKSYSMFEIVVTRDKVPIKDRLTGIGMILKYYLKG